MGTKSSGTCSRRTFLKGAATGIAAGVGAMSTTAFAEETQAPAYIPHTWEVPPAPIPAEEIIETVDADVVIVGGGLAGMTAFMWSAEAGAKTVLIEKLSTFSGRGLDFAAVNTRVQKAAGIEIDKGALVNDLVKATGYKADGSLIKLWADYSGRVFDYLTDMTEAAGGMVLLSSDSSETGGSDFVTRTYPTSHMFEGLLIQGTLNLMGRMEQAGITAGSQTFYDTKAEQLVKDAEGNVTGVIASTDAGYIQYNASKGVILATGDYGGNPEMVKAWCPMMMNADGNVYTPEGGNTGDGINLGMWAGAAIMPACHAAMVHPVFGGGALATTSFLKVNGAGKRFCNEDTTTPGQANMYLTAAGRKVWTIFDSDFSAQMDVSSPLSQHNSVTSGALTALYLSGQADANNPPSYAEVVDLCLENGTTFKADTLEELAAIIDVPAGNLIATVERNNELADAGKDDDFGKGPENLNPVRKPPFYASSLNAKMMVMTTGLNVNSSMQVLDENENPIGGLYAVGNVMGNFFANDYPMCAPGISHGRCLTLGALLGNAVATGTELGENF